MVYVPLSPADVNNDASLHSGESKKLVCEETDYTSGWLAVAAMSDLRRARVLLLQNKFKDAMSAAVSSASTAIFGGEIHLEALLLCAHLSYLIAPSPAPLPPPPPSPSSAVYASSNSSSSLNDYSLTSPLHWLSAAVDYHPRSVHAALLFGIALAAEGRHALAAQWLSDVSAT